MRAFAASRICLSFAWSSRGNPRMSRNNLSIALAGLLMLLVGCASKHSASATKPAANQVTFKSPDDAVKALVAAVDAHDTDQLDKIFGPEGEGILDSGDEVAD